MSRNEERSAKSDFPIELIRDHETGYFFAQHPDLEGCFAQGRTASEAVKDLDEARSLWIADAQEVGQRIPEPLPLEHSGRFSLRMRPGLHSYLARRAKREDVSLNFLITSALESFAGTGTSEERLANALESRLAALDEVTEHLQAVSTGPWNVPPEAAAEPVSAPFAAQRWEDAGPVHKAAYSLILDGHDDEARDLLYSLPSRQISDFFRGLIHLGRSGSTLGTLERGCELCIQAALNGLTSEQASLAWMAIPQRPGFRDLKRQLFLPLMEDHGNDRARASASAWLLSWIEEQCNKPVVALYWKQVATDPNSAAA